MLEMVRAIQNKTANSCVGTRSRHIDDRSDDAALERNVAQIAFNCQMDDLSDPTVPRGQSQSI